MMVYVCNFGMIRLQDFYCVASNERKAILHVLELSTGPISVAIINSFGGDENSA